jgi:hypothetical protein
MATTPRSQLVDSELPMHYHLISRCVRRAWLCGYDKNSRKKYDHRKGWLEARLFHLARYFAIDLDAYAIKFNLLTSNMLDQARCSRAGSGPRSYKTMLT